MGGRKDQSARFSYLCLVDTNDFLATSFYDIKPNQQDLRDSLKAFKSSDFIAWDPLFFNFIGSNAKLERIQSFESEPPTVHEAPAYVPETNELFFSDTKVTGWLWAIEVDTLKVPLGFIEDLQPSSIMLTSPIED